MKNKIILFIFLISQLFISCTTTKSKYSFYNFTVDLRPPNGVEVKPNLFFDRTEMDNIGWREYVYWTQMIFGLDSEEYKATLPDTNVWLQEDSCLHYLSHQYYQKDSYSHFPIVGISIDQARAYSQWRSDRVMEMMLIESKMLEINSHQNRENYFTIERYFRDRKNKKEAKDLYYPNYRLPTAEEWLWLLEFHLSSISNSKTADPFHQVNVGFKRCYEGSQSILPLWAITPDVIQDRQGIYFFGVIGNVAEYTNDGNSLGCYWKEKRSDCLPEQVISVGKKRTSYTGFRNVCEWKKWKD